MIHPWFCPDHRPPPPIPNPLPVPPASDASAAVIAPAAAGAAADQGHADSSFNHDFFRCLQFVMKCYKPVFKTYFEACIWPAAVARTGRRCWGPSTAGAACAAAALRESEARARESAAETNSRREADALRQSEARVRPRRGCQATRRETAKYVCLFSMLRI